LFEKILHFKHGFSPARVPAGEWASQKEASALTKPALSLLQKKGDLVVNERTPKNKKAVLFLLQKGTAVDGKWVSHAGFLALNNNAVGGFKRPRCTKKGVVLHLTPTRFLRHQVSG
jgi:hypothetical protein